jgi:hypothetical protein
MKHGYIRGNLSMFQIILGRFLLSFNKTGCTLKFLWKEYPLAAYLTPGSSIGRRRAEHELRGALKAGRGMVFPASFNDLNNKLYFRRLGDLK